jgi:hypothetical protein
MQGNETRAADDSVRSAYALAYLQSFETALEAGRFFQARTLRWTYALSIVGVLAGAVLATQDLSIGLALAMFCALMLVLNRFALMDRWFGRRRARSVLGRRVELILSDDGIDWTGPQATSHVPWGSITEVRSNARTVLFVRDRLLLAYAPSAAFASAHEQADVVAYAQRQIKAASIDTIRDSSDIGGR